VVWLLDRQCQERFSVSREVPLVALLSRLLAQSSTCNVPYLDEYPIRAVNMERERGREGQQSTTANGVFGFLRVWHKGRRAYRGYTS
jgi:hypothetical protein